MVIRIPIAFSLAISALVTTAYLGIPYFNLFQKCQSKLAELYFLLQYCFYHDGAGYDEMVRLHQNLWPLCNIIVGKRSRGGTAIVNILVQVCCLVEFPVLRRQTYPPLRLVISGDVERRI